MENTPWDLPHWHVVKKMNIKQTDLCEYCGEIDNIQHFFYDCPSVKSLWQEIERHIEVITKRYIHLSARNIIVGLDSEVNSQIKTLKIINLIILIGKITISKVKYGKHKNFRGTLEQEFHFRKNYINL